MAKAVGQTPDSPRQTAGKAAPPPTILVDQGASSGVTWPALARVSPFLPIR